MKKSITFLFAAVLSSASFANLIVNGDFESQPNYGINGNGGYTSLIGNEMPGWTINSGHAVTVHNTSQYPTISGIYSVNVDGEGINGHNADFYQDFATTSGSLYNLEFDWAGWQQGIGTLDVRIENVSDSLNTVLDNQFDWFDTGITHHVSGQFFGDGGVYRLHIFMNPETGINDNTFIVDNFSVTEVVPEPASMTVMAMGALALLRRRKKS